MSGPFFKIFLVCLFLSLGAMRSAGAQEDQGDHDQEYTVGIDDILDIIVIQPDQLSDTVTVTPDGSVSFTYIGTFKVIGMTLEEMQREVESRLSDGYMKYPVVTVTLRESRSRKFYVYGEVNKPGTYPLTANTTVLRAISMAGGFTRYGSSSRVKLLRPKKNEPGYENIKININKVMNGDADADLVLDQGDILVVEEGVF